MSIYVTSTETPLYWTTLEERRTYATLASLSLTWPGSLLEPHEVAWLESVRTVNALERSPEPAHQWGCPDPYGKPAWCDCNSLTRADACDRWDCGPDCTHPDVGAGWCACEGTGCMRCLF